jgi:hypothetical protein
LIRGQQFLEDSSPHPAQTDEPRMNADERKFNDLTERGRAV